MKKRKIDLILCETIVIALLVCAIVLFNIVGAVNSTQAFYFKHQDAILLVDLIALVLGVLRVRIFFNDIED